MQETVPMLAAIAMSAVAIVLGPFTTQSRQ